MLPNCSIEIFVERRLQIVKCQKNIELIFRKHFKVLIPMLFLSRNYVFY
jgi:hypothetical protein